jgi:hypothetical protein
MAAATSAKAAKTALFAARQAKRWRRLPHRKADAKST